MKFILFDGTLSSSELLELSHIIDGSLQDLDNDILIGFGIFSTFTSIFELGVLLLLFQCSIYPCESLDVGIPSGSESYHISAHSVPGFSLPRSSQMADCNSRFSRCVEESERRFSI